MPKTDDSVWSFNLRSYNPRDFSDSDSDDVPVDNPCSDGSTLVDHSLSEDNDTAVFKPNPWSIARINAASRVAQKSPQRDDDISLNKNIKKCDKKQPQGKIVDFLKKQARQPPSDTSSGLRPPDASFLSSGAKKLASHIRRSPPSGYLEKAVGRAKAHSLSAQTSVSRSLGLSTDTVDSGRSLCIYRKTATLPQQQTSLRSSSTIKEHLLDSLGHSADLLCTQLPQAIQAQSSITLTFPPAPASTHPCEMPTVDPIHTHQVFEEQNRSPTKVAKGAHTYPSLIFGLRLIFPCHPSPSPHFLPQNQRDLNEPSGSVPLSDRALFPSLPTPELVGASRPAPPRRWESAYDHLALRPSTEDDCEWSTFPRRKPQPRKLQKDLINTSAKFRLPIRSCVQPPPTETHEERTEKRPRITLYRPPPRTATADLAGIEGRYTCVRDAMRKRRRASGAAWDALGLPSCGTVYVDGSAAMEVGILVWPRD
ncbi:hypothetical protein BJV74DRAFT_949681, partial [Russula compacta]